MMRDEAFEQFVDQWLDFLEGERDGPPDKSELPAHLHDQARAYEDSLTACRDVDPHASRPPLEELLSERGTALVATALEAQENAVKALDQRDKERWKAQRELEPVRMLRRIAALETRVAELEDQLSQQSGPSLENMIRSTFETTIYPALADRLSERYGVSARR